MLAMVSIGLTACGDDRAQGNAAESVLQGTATILVDSAIVDLLAPAKSAYDSLTPKAKITFKAVDSRTAMAELFALRTRGVIVGRDYLPDEQEAAKKLGTEFPRSLLATDALVFYTTKAFPSDTINAEQIAGLLRGASVNVKPLGLASVPTFVLPGINSTAYGNVVNVVLHGQRPTVSFLMTPTQAAARATVLEGKGRIGIGLLSQFAHDTAVKLLRVGFNDSTGARVYPQHVHQGYVVQGMYPYPVPIYIVLKEQISQHSLPTGLLQFLAKDGTAQRTFLNAGIVPAHAKLELHTSE